MIDDKAAAYGRLCVETYNQFEDIAINPAAAYGRLCVETLPYTALFYHCRQPPTGGCVLKRRSRSRARNIRLQPPTGGCVLKQSLYLQAVCLFRQPPTGGCVLKQNHQNANYLKIRAAAYGRLCVETFKDVIQYTALRGSRLRAAVC